MGLGWRAVSSEMVGLRHGRPAFLSPILAIRRSQGLRVDPCTCTRAVVPAPHKLGRALLVDCAEGETGEGRCASLFCFQAVEPQAEIPFSTL